MSDETNSEQTVQCCDTACLLDKPVTQCSNDTAVTGGLSKSKLKKLLREQQYQSRKVERRAAQKERRKLKRLAKDGAVCDPRKKLKLCTMETSNCKVQVAVDCSFDSLMADKDISKLVQQLQYCYSTNRRSTNPMQLYMTSIGGQTQQRLQRLGDYKGWDVNFSEQSYLEVFNKADIVYLTSDSPNILTSLQPDKTYVIGGLVDHNHHKGMCFDLAVKNEVAHAQLPIGEYMKLNTRNVLTVNHVFEILLRYTETESWKEAFYRVIPKRKQVSRAEKKMRQLSDSASVDVGAVNKDVDASGDDVQDSSEEDNEVTDRELDKGVDRRDNDQDVIVACDVDVGNNVNGVNRNIVNNVCTDADKPRLDCVDNNPSDH